MRWPWTCARLCGLAQLADDDTVADEPRGVEPQALKDQAEDAIERVAAVGLAAWEHCRRIRQPAWWHVDPAARRAWVHYRDVAGRRRAGLFRHHARTRPARAPSRGAPSVTAPGGVLLLQYHSIGTDRRAGPVECVAARAFRLLFADCADAPARVRSECASSPHGSSTCTAERCCSQPCTARPYPTNLFSASSPSEEALGMTDPDCHRPPPTQYADRHVESLRNWLEEEAEAGRTVLAYGAASRAVALFSRAGLNADLLAAVADASVAKQGRRMPGTDIPIVSPDELLAARPDRVLLTLPDLLPELRARMPELDGRWTVDGQFTE